MHRLFLTLFVGLVLTSCTGGSDSTQSDATLPEGERLLQAKGCLACHSTSGGPGIGPTFKGLFGKTETLLDGTKVVVDADYLKESIREPAKKIVRGYQPLMPAMPLTGEEVQTLIRYLQTLK